MQKPHALENKLQKSKVKSPPSPHHPPRSLEICYGGASGTTWGGGVQLGEEGASSKLITAKKQQPNNGALGMDCGVADLPKAGECPTRVAKF